MTDLFEKYGDYVVELHHATNPYDFKEFTLNELVSAIEEQIMGKIGKMIENAEKKADKGDRMDKLNASEALYGFGGWLTTRGEAITISAQHDASVMAELVNEFCKVNELSEPRDGWDKNLIHPPDKPSGD